MTVARAKCHVQHSTGMNRVYGYLSVNGRNGTHVYLSVTGRNGIRRYRGGMEPWNGTQRYLSAKGRNGTQGYVSDTCHISHVTRRLEKHCTSVKLLVTRPLGEMVYPSEAEWNGTQKGKDRG